MINLKTCFSLMLIVVCIQTSGQPFTSGQVFRDTALNNWLNNQLSQGQTKVDSILKIKYFNDTVGFINFPNSLLLDSLIPNEAISYWELNLNSGDENFTNLYKSTKGENKLSNDTFVLTKANSSFGTVCPPSSCSWYISTKLKNGKTETVTDWRTLSTFIGKIDNQFDAYLWLTCFNVSPSQNIPLKVSTSLKYKIINDGYLILVNRRVGDCPIVNADILYFVRKDKNVTFIQILKTIYEGGCI